MLKKTLIVAASGFAMIAAGSTQAATVGGYVGLKAGYDFVRSSSSKTDDDGDTMKRKDYKGFAWGAQVGYNFMRYFGLQLGYNNFSQVKYTVSGTVNGTPKINIYDVDLMAFGYLPLDNNWDLIAGAGMAYVKTKFKDVSFITDFKNKSESWWRPKAELGVGYNFNQNMALKLTYSRVFGTGSMQKLVNEDNGDKYLPSLDMAALSFDYNFGNM